MKFTFIYFLRHYIFWLVIFIFFRILFLVSTLPLLNEIKTGEFILTLFAGFKLDISTASYFALIPFFFTVISIFIKNSFISNSLKWYSRIILLLVILLSISNIIIFKLWGTLLNSRALGYVAQPKEMFASTTTGQLFLLIGTLIILMYVTMLFYKRFLHPSFIKMSGTTLQRLFPAVIILPLLVIGMRGGFQLIPINESAATFSDNRILNQVAVNNIWYLGHNVKQSGLKQQNPYLWMSSSEAENIVKQLVKGESTASASIFNIKTKPNIVIILLESWTADIIEPLSDLKGVTPKFSELCKEGLLFSSVYSSGFRTDQALISVLSGFPSQPNHSIIRYPDKTLKLPAIARDLKDSGYATSFYYGGELGFANMNNYLVSSGFEKIISIDDFNSRQLNSKWGAHDEYVLNLQAESLKNHKQPFFSTLLTLSTHEPFDVPVPTPFNGTSEEEQFKKSAWYTDWCLGNYFMKIKKTEWYQNTIFILLADHGHRLPLNRDYYDPELRKIPLLIWSPLLKPEFKGTLNTSLSGQHDLAATILASLNMSHAAYKWSNNMLDTTRSDFAYLSLDAAVTFMQDSLEVIIPLEHGLPGYDKILPAQHQGKGYLQHLYTTFLAY